MAQSAELSSSLSFTSSSHLSNGSVDHNVCSSYGFDPAPNLQVISLNKLSSSLEQLLVDSDSSYSDADIIVEGIPVSVHRCILASRSKIFNELFKRGKGSSDKEGKLKYHMSDLLPYGKVGYEAFLIFLGYIYTGKMQPSPMELSTCLDDTCAHDACRPAINFTVELMYASSTFQIPDLFYLEKGTQEEQRIKRMRFMELKEDVQKAFNKDKAEFTRSGITSSSRSLSRKETVNYKGRL